MNPTTDQRLLARRQLLARMAALGATLGATPSLLRAPGPAGAAAAHPSTPTVAVPQAVRSSPGLTLDAFSGIAAFAVPGDDEYSVHQGVSTAEPGGIAAEAPRLLADTLNTYLAVPEVAAFLVEALQTELATVPLPGGLDGLAWLDGLLEVDGTLPLAPVVAAIVSLLAVLVQPASVAGPFLTPFPRLTWDEKGEVWRRFETELPALFTIGAPGSRLPILSTILDLLATLGGLLRFAAGAVLEVAVFAAYSEFAVFDPATRTLTGRPVGWDLAGYPPERPVDGWDELLGYYQGRTTADA